MSKTLQSLLHEYCSIRPEWILEYTDVNPSGHSMDTQALQQLEPCDQPNHPQYKTRLCQAKPCLRGNICPFAHGPSELRVPSSNTPNPSYQFAIALQRPGQSPLEFCNLDSHPQKSEAKADCAAQCIRALGLKVTGGKLVDDDSWTIAGLRVPKQPEAGVPKQQAAGTQEACGRPPIPQWQKRQLLEVISRLNQAEPVQNAAKHGYEQWVACIGGRFGSAQPRLAHVMRVHYGSFKNFVTIHAGQVPHPKPPPQPSPQPPPQPLLQPPPQPPPQPSSQPSSQPPPQQAQAAAQAAAQELDAVTLSSFYDAMSEWIRGKNAGGRRVSAADVGQFYMDHPEFDGVAKGRWKPSRHCERDGRLTWVPDDTAPGMGWIEVPGETWLVPPPSPMAERGTMEAADVGDGLDAISWLTSTAKRIGLGVPLELQQQLHPAVLEIVQATGNNGIDVPALRMQLELGLRLTNTIKTARLVQYARSFPTVVQVTESSDVAGANTIHRIHALEPRRQGSDAWQHASRFLRADASAGGLDSTYEFLDAQGIDQQTLRLMNTAELVTLGLSADAASKVLSDARLGAEDEVGAQNEYDGDVYADYHDYDAELQSLNAVMQRQNAELMQRCSDLQLRVSVLEEARLCCICMERKRDTVLMPCMHAMFCSLCLRSPTQATACPTCRGPIAGLIECRFDMVDEAQASE